MQKVILDDSLFIAKGSGRSCYTHPNDESKLIKIKYSQAGIDNDQNLIDYRYINYLRKNKKSLKHIAQCYEYVDTNLGTGLVCDRIVNYDQSVSKSFRYFMAKKIITLEHQQKLLNELKDYLESEAIVFVDNSLRNILCQEISEGQYRLIIIDGLGAKREGLKFWLYLNVNLYRTYKIKRQWMRLSNAYKIDLARIDLNENPITRF